MKVIEHSSSQLVITYMGDFTNTDNGGDFFMRSPEKIFMDFLGVFLAIFLMFYVAQNFSLPGILSGISIVLFIYFGVILQMRSIGLGRPPTYTLDKFSNVLSCSTPPLFPWNPPQVINFLLNDIVEVESVIKKEDDPPPLYSYSINLKMKEKTITLHPENEEKMKEMSDLIRNFLGLEQV